MLAFSITVWYAGCTVADRKRLQRVIKSAGFDKESRRGGGISRMLIHVIEQSPTKYRHFKVDRETSQSLGSPTSAAERIKIAGRTAWGSNTVI